jgi:signal transduction histidine kinase
MHILTNRNYLSKALSEVLYNAKKFTTEGCIVLRIRTGARVVRFIVEDTGPGIPEEDAPRLLESFTKANELSEGLGLGLPLTKRHVTNLGGELILDTTYKAGCRFIIQLPKVKS